jgi:hypothetical protein
MTEAIPIKNFDGLPSDLVRPHQSGEETYWAFLIAEFLKMARGQSAFKQTDVTRALRAVSAARQPVQRIEIDPATGKIVVFVGKPEEQDTEGNEWDKI